VTNSLVTGKDATAGLVNLGVGQLVNNGANAVSDFVKSAGADDSITGEDQSGVKATGSTESGLNAVATNDANNATSGGLNQVAPTSTDLTSSSTAGTGETSITGAKTTDQTSDNTVSGGLNQLANTSPSSVDTSLLSDKTATDTSPSTSATKPAEDTLSTIGKDSSQNPSTSSAMSNVLTGAATAGANAVKNQLASTAKRALTSTLVKPLTNASARPQPTAKQLAAMQVARTKAMPPPIQMDVSKLIPIKTSTAPKATPPMKVDVSKLTPISSGSSLTSILNNIKKPG
jgi:hypothetical protein